jgi:hypothetical protein
MSKFEISDEEKSEYRKEIKRSLVFRRSFCFWKHGEKLPEKRGMKY